MGEDRRDKWEMPKPIFRQSGGFTPRGYGKRDQERIDGLHEDMKSVETHDAMLLTMYAPPAALAEPSPVEDDIPTLEPMRSSAIEEQPTITEQFAAPEMPVPVAAERSSAAFQPPSKKSGFFGKLLIILGVLAVIAAGLVVLGYYLFFSSQTQNNNF